MSWWDNRDRIPSDYGEPQTSNTPEMDFDREAELIRLSQYNTLKDDDNIPF